MGEYERFIEQQRAARLAEAEAAKQAAIDRDTEIERLLRVSKHNAMEFVDFMQRNGIPGDPVFTMEVAQIYVKDRGRRGLIEVPEQMARNRYNSLKNDHYQGRRVTYRPTARRGWAICAPRSPRPTLHPHDIQEPGVEGLLLLDDGIPVRTFAHDKSHLYDRQRNDIENFSPPEGSLVIRPESYRAGKMDYCFADESGKLALLHCAERQLEGRDPVPPPDPAPYQ